MNETDKGLSWKDIVLIQKMNQYNMMNILTKQNHLKIGFFVTTLEDDFPDNMHSFPSQFQSTFSDMAVTPKFKRFVKTTYLGQSSL